MLQIRNQPVPQRLACRFEALGLVLLRINTQGGARALGVCSWFERVVIRSPLFAAAARSALPGATPGRCITLWPGLHLAPLNLPAEEVGERLAVLMIGPEILASDQLRAVCDHARLDFRATSARIDVARLVHAGEARRLAMTFGWLDTDLAVVQTQREELRAISGELGNTYEELSLLYKLSSSMTVQRPPHEFLLEVVAELQQVVGIQWLALHVTDEDPRLKELAGRLYTAGTVATDQAAVRQLGGELLEGFGQQTQPVILDDSHSMGPVLAPLAAQLGTNLLVVPLTRGDRPLGVLFGSDRLDGQPLSSVDAKLCASLCNTLSIFLDNAMLYEDARAMFLGVLHALTAAIDAKDTYTYGHSERVALLSRMLAQAAGLDDHTVERVYLAGLLHDVGKIGVPETVLCKPGRLTEQEFQIITTHPAIGANIVGDIPQMQDLIPGVLYHHERWDGCGYPEKRAGEDIPIFGRLIGLADAFDAMSTNRTYRSALNPQQVLAEIRRHAGKQFDPTLAELFLNLDFAPFHRLIESHRTQKSAHTS